MALTGVAKALASTSDRFENTIAAHKPTNLLADLHVYMYVPYNISVSIYIYAYIYRRQL